VPSADATVVKRLNDAGAVLVAKLSLGALALNDIWFGGQTMNTWLLEEGSSGSSAGPGLYVPSDPGGVDAHAQKGYLLMPFGKIFEKGLTLRTGQCNVKKENRHLGDLIVRGRAKPSVVVSNVLSLDQAPMAYDKFDKRVEGYTKVILKPSA